MEHRPLDTTNSTWKSVASIFNSDRLQPDNSSANELKNCSLSSDTEKAPFGPAPITEAKKFVCVHCSFSTKKKSEFKLHQKIHKANREMYECSICGKQLTSKGFLRSHLQKIHGWRQPIAFLPVVKPNQTVYMPVNNSESSRGFRQYQPNSTTVPYTEHPVLLDQFKLERHRIGNHLELLKNQIPEYELCLKSYAPRKCLIDRNVADVKRGIENTFDRLIAQLREREQSLIESAEQQHKIQLKVLDFEEEKLQTFLTQLITVCREGDKYFKKKTSDTFESNNKLVVLDKKISHVHRLAGSINKEIVTQLRFEFLELSSLFENFGSISTDRVPIKLRELMPAEDTESASFASASTSLPVPIVKTRSSSEYNSVSSIAYTNDVFQYPEDDQFSVVLLSDEESEEQVKPEPKLSAFSCQFH